MRKVTNGKLTVEMIEWAYEKWCIGYTLEQIADALGVHRKTIYRHFEGRPRIRPRLEYEKERDEK